MSDRFRELAEKLADEVWARASPTLMASTLESALRKLADEIREEDAALCGGFLRPQDGPNPGPHDRTYATACADLADAIRSKKTKPPSEGKPE
jgi:hypothetical protein